MTQQQGQKDQQQKAPAIPSTLSSYRKPLPGNLASGKPLPSPVFGGY
jgi:hypothetical protein